MRTRWVVVLLALTLGSAISAFAGSPTMGVLDPSCNKNTPGVIDVDNSFVNGSHVTLPSLTSINGGGTFTYCNLTQLYWTQVDFNTSNFGGFASGVWTFNGSASDPTGTPIACNAGFGQSDQSFLQCTVTITSTSVDINFSGVNGSPGQGNDILGIRNNHTMTVTLNTGYCQTGVNGCQNGGDWVNPNGGPITLAGSANGVPAPEPASLLLLGTGIGAVLLRQRKRISTDP